MMERLRIVFISISVWWILLLPFDYFLFDWFFKSVQFPFTHALKSLDEGLLFETDTYGTYLLVSLSISLGVLSAFGISWICRRFQLSSTELLKTVLAAILFFFLVKYGWNKLTKSQFYMPEPNTLYTPLGKLSKDIAYWSVMGSSYSYTLFLGITEVLAAFLLVFKRTQFLASIITVGVLTQVFAVNCSFDISVKLLSGSLLLFSLVYSACFWENWKAILGFSPHLPHDFHTKKRVLLKTVFVVTVLVECIFPTVLSGNFNDDNYPRLMHHGAYRVEGSHTIKRVFVHRREYLILERWDGQFLSYPLNVSDEKIYQTTIGNISCTWKKDHFQLIDKEDTFDIHPIPFQRLPLLENDFHLFSDAFH